MAQKILIVEDDSNINELLKEVLQEAGYETVQAFSGTEASMRIGMESYSLVILDLMLPGKSGDAVLAEIRENSQMPVIILTAKDALDEKVTLLTSGADDYITKPFDIQELLARVQIQLRHAGRQENKNCLSRGDLELDRTHFQVKVSGTVIDNFTKREFAILELLLRNPERVFSKEEMFEYAWEEPYVGETKTLDVHISNIRKKLKNVTDTEYIETVWGIGYRLKK